HVDMTTSQDVALAVALEEMGHELPTAVRVAAVTPDSPSEGVLEEGDRITRVGETRIDEVQTLLRAVRRAEPGEPLPIRVVRDGERLDLEVTPEKDRDAGRDLIGVYPGTSYVFPFEVSIGIDPN